MALPREPGPVFAGDLRISLAPALGRLPHRVGSGLRPEPRARAAEVDLFHDCRVEARAAHHVADDERRQVIGPHVLQVAVMTPHRGPDGSHNYRFRHSASPNAGHHPVVGFGLRGGSLLESLETVSHTSHRKREARGKYTST